ncbi:MAG: helix-turn-helix domain-containing protein [Verrucomicrobiaceae bacterium]
MPPTLGQHLKHAREKRGLSLADVSHQTKIPWPRLKDMEDDNFNALGGMAYTRSFVQTYARLLNVNADSVLEQMQTPPLGGARDYRYLLESHGSWIHKQGQFSAPPVKNMTQHRSVGALLAICGVVLIIGMGVLLGQAWLGERKTNAVSNPRPASNMVAKPDATATDTPVVSLRALPASTGDFLKPGVKPVEAHPNPPVAGVPKAMRVEGGAPPKALPVEDGPAKSKR